jgi:ankyrin repeat protein
MALFLLAALPHMNRGVGQDLTTPLHEVAARGQFELVRLLVEQGADVNAEDLMGQTPLHHAVEYPDIVRYLVDNGAAVNEDDVHGETPLHLAVRTPESARILVENGASVAFENHFGETPLDLALDWSFFESDTEVVRLLINAGAGVD